VKIRKGGTDSRVFVMGLFEEVYKGGEEGSSYESCKGGHKWERGMGTGKKKK